MKNKETFLYSIPTPTLLVTDLGVLAIAPELRKTAEDVFRAVRLGMDLDDFWDFGVVPRPQNGFSEVATGEIDSQDFYEKYFKSYGRFINGLEGKTPSEKKRVSDNSGWFVSSIHHLEGEAISKPRLFWNPETVRDYRESVAIIWAMFLASLNEGCSLNLYEIANSRCHFSLADCYAWMNDDSVTQLEKIYTKRMYYGALVFQVVSDYGKRAFARKNYIPSFGGIGFEEFSEEQLRDYVEIMTNKYLQGAKECGVDEKSLKIFLKVFPNIQRVLNCTKKSKATSFWAYS